MPRGRLWRHTMILKITSDELSIILTFIMLNLILNANLVYICYLYYFKLRFYGCYHLCFMFYCNMEWKKYSILSNLIFLRKKSSFFRVCRKTVNLLNWMFMENITAWLIWFSLKMYLLIVPGKVFFIYFEGGGDTTLPFEFA